jgi:hypothetical protein
MPQLSFRADPELLERLDALRAAMKRRLRGVDVSRSDLLRTLIMQSLALAEVEYELQPEPKFYYGEAGNRRALFADTISTLLQMAELERLDLEVPGYEIKKLAE